MERRCIYCETEKDFPVSIIGDEEVYRLISQMSDMGGHTLLSYIDKEGSVNILASLFGIAVYNVKLCNNIIRECPYNVLFLTINLDAQRTSSKYRSVDELAREIPNGFQKQVRLMVCRCYAQLI